MISRDTFEAHLKGCLDSQNCAQPLKNLWAKYQLAKDALPQEILTWIPTSEPNLTDHGILHIDNVIENAARLLNLDPAVDFSPASDKNPFDGLDIKPVEAFVLGMALLFHDTGNVLGRSGHADRAATIFAKITRGHFQNSEVRLIGAIMAAHSGTAKNGSSDTISDLPEAPDYFCREPIRMRRLAALVRFADELAEGPQRTSNYLRATGRFKADSKERAQDNSPKRNIFHDYASITNINIDRGHGRIAIQYSVDLEDPMFVLAGRKGKQYLRKLLELCFMRIRKTDEERRYARYYGGELLSDFQSTEVVLRFHRGGNYLETGLKPLIINDLVVPTNYIPKKTQEWIRNCDQNYDIKALVKKVWP